MYKQKIKWTSFLLIGVMSIVLSGGGAIFSHGASAAWAMAGPINEMAQIGSVQTLVDWHAESDKSGFAQGQLTGDLVVVGSVRLAASEGSAAGEIMLGTFGGSWQGEGFALTVTSGASLVLDDPRFVLVGPSRLIVVEDGGRLELRRGAVAAAGGGDAVVVHQGGNITVDSGFKLSGSVADENVPGNAGQPGTGDSGSDNSEGIPQSAAITGFFPPPALFCQAGTSPASVSGPSVSVTYGRGMNASLPVQWDLSSVNFDAAGVYTVSGRFTEEALAQQGLSNPKGFSPSLKIRVEKPGPLTELKTNVLSSSQGSSIKIKLTFPALPKDAGAVFLYYSRDSLSWEAAGSGGDAAANLIDRVTGNEGDVNSYLICEIPWKTGRAAGETGRAAGETIYLKLEIVGSLYAGESIVTAVAMPSGNGSAETPRPEEDEDDGSQGGNRGNVGHGPAQREEEALKPLEPLMPEKAYGADLGTQDAGSSMQEQSAGGTAESSDGLPGESQSGRAAGEPQEQASSPGASENSQGESSAPVSGMQGTALGALDQATPDRQAALSESLEDKPQATADRGFIAAAATAVILIIGVAAGWNIRKRKS